MTGIEPVILSFGAALLLGLGFGAGPCNITCLPYLGPVFTATEGGIRNSWRLLLPFSLGRMSGYALLGATAGWAGLVAQQWIDAPWVRWLLGGGTILVALSILWRRRYQPAQCAQHKSTIQHTDTQAPLKVAPPGANPPESGGKALNALPTGLFLMGMGMALNPCAPLTTVILAAATTASLSAGLSLGLGFGIGAIIIPTLVFAFGVAHFGDQIRHHLSQWRIALENTSVGLLFLLGTGTAMGWIAP
ncbi:MAG: sulfite exporter TauE/SafE family protein [Candidatus Sedimenticola sp. (ex Thyasira tokunagai)]